MAPGARLPAALLALLAAFSMPPTARSHRVSAHDEASEAAQLALASAPAQAALRHNHTNAEPRAQWMYADTWDVKLASVNPLRWSDRLTKEEVIRELEGRSNKDRKRPVIVDIGDLRKTCNTVEEVKALFNRYSDPARYVPIDEMVPNFDCGSEYGFADTTLGPALPDLMASAPSWCNANLVPPEKRVPESLQGLYWMMHLKLDDVAFCTSLAEYNQEKREARLVPWNMFVVRKKPEEEVPALLLKAGKLPVLRKALIYTLTFSDDSLTEAKITTNVPAMNMLINFPLKSLEETRDGLVRSEKPGDIFDRPSFIMNQELTNSSYYAVRVMEPGGYVHQDRYELMKKLETAQGGTLVRYAPKC